MTGQDKMKQDTVPVGIEWEYKTLRDEILQRIEMRQQMVSITLTIAGAFLAVGLTTQLVALVYPPLAMFLALGWVQNDQRIRHAAAYIRDNIESTVTGMSFETFTQNAREQYEMKQGLASFRFVKLSHGGTFLLTQMLAIGVGLSRFQRDAIGYLLLVVGVLSILIVVGVFGLFHTFARWVKRSKH